MKSNLSRRQFLVHSASIAGASLGLGTSQSSRGDSAPACVRVGFIGLGDRGRHLLGAMLRAQAKERGQGVESSLPVEVVALCDIDPRRLKRALDLVEGGAPVPGGGTPGKRPRGFTNFRALLDAPEVDAVFIATPVHLHGQHAITALLAGKHVYSEKPMAHDVDECRQILAAAQTAGASGKIFQIGLQRRYSPRYRRSIRYVHAGEAGRVLFVRAQWHTSGNPARDKPWMFRREKSGDIVVEQACHQFDVFNWLFQATPVRACGFGGAELYAGDPPGRNTMDHYSAVLEYPGGGKVHLSHLSFAIPERRFSGIYELAFCERAGVDLANALAWNAGGKTVDLTGAAGGDATAWGGRRGEKGGEIGNETQLAAEGFIHSILSGRPPEASAQVGYEATLAALLCRRALETGRAVGWEELAPA